MHTIIPFILIIAWFVITIDSLVNIARDVGHNPRNTPIRDIIFFILESVIIIGIAIILTKI